MIVVDASAVVELLVALEAAPQLHARLTDETLVAPDVLAVEVASALRGLHLGGRLGDDDLDRARDDLLRLPVDLHPSLPLVPHVLALRNNFSAYDASYVALALAFRCPLLTLDRKLAKAARMHCGVEIVEA